MGDTSTGAGRPVTVYVTAGVVGVTFALGVGWALLEADVASWWAAACWLPVTAYLSRKRLPSEVIGSALQLGAGLALLAPTTPYVAAAVKGAEIRAIAVAKELFGPVLVVVVVAGVAYAVGLWLKRHAERKLARRARKGVYRSGERADGRGPSGGRA